ncbi:MAG: adenosine deaminase family protein [bacterium]|nr:adenosine deaminase family protein [bacterium]
MTDRAASTSPYSNEFLQALPKTDLHLHLDGSLRLPTLIELARKHGVKLPSYEPEGLLELVFKENYRDLPDYLHGFAYTSPVLCDPESLEQAAYELGEDCLAEGVHYIEVRFAPQLHVRPGFDVGQIITAVDRGLDRVRRDHEASEPVTSEQVPPFRYGIIACAMRFFTDGFAPYYKTLLAALEHNPATEVYGLASMALARSVVEVRDRTGLPVVGFDLAGAEAGHPAQDHEAAFEYAKRHFLKTTVHAGEAYGPESMFQAITGLNADRIGHGTHLYSSDLVHDDEDPERYVRQLAEYVADRRITLEVCITSNMQTMPELRQVRNHPFGRMMREKLSVTMCTDNRLISRTSVTQEIAQACEAFHITPAELRNLIIYGFKRSFYPGTYREKRAYVRQVINRYDQVAKEHGVTRV